VDLTGRIPDPLTPIGLGLLARSGWNLILSIQVAFGLFIGLWVAWLIHTQVYPALEAAISRSPETAVLHQGIIHGFQNGNLSYTPMISISVDVEGAGENIQPSDFQFTITKDRLVIGSFLGSMEMFFPANGTIKLGRSSLEPWWGAWKSIFSVGIVLGVGLSLLLGWNILSLLYFVPLKLLAFILDRRLSWSWSFHLANLIQIPAAIFMVFVIFLYGIRTIDLIRFALLYGVHWVITLLYMFFTPLFLERLQAVSKPSPFSASKGE